MNITQEANANDTGNLINGQMIFRSVIVRNQKSGGNAYLGNCKVLMVLTPPNRQAIVDRRGAHLRIDPQDET